MLQPLYSNYIVYVDECGDHSLESINKEFPVFALACCVVKKSYYVEKIVPAIQQFKFQFFGHDIVILHAHEIRKSLGIFKLLLNKETRTNFFSTLNELIESLPFMVISSVIHKSRLVQQYDKPFNPYHLSLTFCLERLYEFVKEKGEEHLKTFIVFESRGKKEDIDLELEFRRVCDGNNLHDCHYPFEILFSDKQINSSGLQLADLVAHPIAKSVIDNSKHNQAFDIIKNKFMKGSGHILSTAHKNSLPDQQKTILDGWGIKVFPS